MALHWWTDPTKPDAYGEPLAEILRAADRYEWGPGKPNEALRPRLASLREVDIVAGRPLRCREAASACLAGLWLLHNFLDESHKISQTLSSANGSFWHAIMHRREPDYSNSKYWFHRVGRHSVLEKLAEHLAALRNESSAQQRLQQHGLTVWDIDYANTLRKLHDRVVGQHGFDPFAFVDICHEAAGRDASPLLRAYCAHVGWLEWQLLFDHCYRAI